VHDQYACGKEPVEACVAKLRAALRAELAAPELRLLGTPEKSCRERWSACDDFVDACTPVAGVIADELLELGPAAAASTPEMVEALHKGSIALTAVAFRALAAFQSPEALPIAMELLDARDDVCRWVGLDALKEIGPASGIAVPKLIGLLDHEDWFNRRRVASLLGKLGNPRAIEPLHRALTHPPMSTQVAAAKALGQFGAAASEALTDLESLAARHWSYSVRVAAADAATAISGRSVLPRAPSCHAHAKDIEGRWTFLVDSQSVELLPVARDAPKTVDMEDGTRIVLVNNGEFAGEIASVQGGTRHALREGPGVNPMRVVAVRDGYLVVEGLRHITLDEGLLTRLWRLPDGKWQAEPVLELAGAPIAFAVTAQGELLLLTDDASEPVACPEPSSSMAVHTPVYLLRIASSDGSAQSLP
jgi:HEAT repeats